MHLFSSVSNFEQSRRWREDTLAFQLGAPPTTHPLPDWTSKRPPRWRSSFCAESSKRKIWLNTRSNGLSGRLAEAYKCMGLTGWRRTFWGLRMKFRKLVATVVMAAVFFWTPSVFPTKAVAAFIGCGHINPAWIPADTAFAGIPIAPIPCPTPSSQTPWPVIVLGAGVVSLILNAAIVSQTQCRELTLHEAYSSFLLPFLGIVLNQHIDHCHPKHNH